MAEFDLHHRRRERRAVAILVFTCVIWGMGFNWNKQGQAVLGTGLAEVGANESMTVLGPAWFLAIRFVLATACWALLFPRSLRGWSRQTAIGGFWGGFFLSTGMLSQHYGLSYTSESLSSFLTSLAVLFTPLMVVAFLRQRVGVWMWVSVAFATVGVAFMTLHREEAGFDRGAFFGLLCAVAFSGHILVLDHYGKKEDPWRFSLAQFVVAAIIFFVFSRFAPLASRSAGVLEVIRAASSSKFLALLVLTTLPGTILTFGLMFRFQPDTTATRAALIYLSEPIFATSYAWWASGTRISAGALVGAALILLGNLVAELLGRRTGAGKPTRHSPELVEPLLD